jgi:hypothetical protein
MEFRMCPACQLTCIVALVTNIAVLKFVIGKPTMYRYYRLFKHLNMCFMGEQVEQVKKFQ